MLGSFVSKATPGLSVSTVNTDPFSWGLSKGDRAVTQIQHTMTRPLPGTFARIQAMREVIVPTETMLK